MSFNTDILVIGGGITGSVAACALGQAGFEVVSLDPAGSHLPTTDFEPRVSSINLESEYLLQQCGIWQRLDSARLQSFDRIEVWDDGMAESLVFEAADAGLPHLGHIIENEHIRYFALESALEQPGVRLVPQGLETFHQSAEGIRAITSDGTEIQARLIVGSDGANSLVRRIAGIERDVFDYRQRAIVCQVYPEALHNACAHQKFLPTGPLAFLPLADGSCSIVWSLSEQVVDEYLALDDGEFCQLLAEEFEFRLGAVERCGPRFTFPLKRSHARRYVANNLALIGDACHTVHPLAGLGANQGLADVHELVSVLEYPDPDVNWHGEHRLRRYERRRRSNNRLTLATMDFFHAGFSNDNALIKYLRQSGLIAVNRIPALKNRFVAHATRLSGTSGL